MDQDLITTGLVWYWIVVTQACVNLIFLWHLIWLCHILGNINTRWKSPQAKMYEEFCVMLANIRISFLNCYSSIIYFSSSKRYKTIKKVLILTLWDLYGIKILYRRYRSISYHPHTNGRQIWQSGSTVDTKGQLWITKRQPEPPQNTNEGRKIHHKTAKGKLGCC